MSSKPGFGSKPPLHPNAPKGGGGPGKFTSKGSLNHTSNATAHFQSPKGKLGQPVTPLKNATAANTIPVTEMNGVYYIKISQDVEMLPFIREADVSFEQSVKGFALTSKLDIAINGNMYDVGLVDGLQAMAGINQPGDATKPLGFVAGKGKVIGGISSPQMFFVAWDRSSGFKFGAGDPPSVTSAVGGLGPLVIGGLRYGVENLYRNGVPAGAPKVGEPAPAFKAFLEQRSNATYTALAQRGASVGKVIVGFASSTKTLHIVVQEDGTAGESLDNIRDVLIKSGVDNAVFFDGSNSATLYANAKFYVRPAGVKNRTNTIGVGFRGH